MAGLEIKPNGVKCPCGSRHTYWRKWQQLYRCRKCDTLFKGKDDSDWRRSQDNMPRTSTAKTLGPVL